MTLSALRALVEKEMTPPPSTVVKALIAVAEAAQDTERLARPHHEWSARAKAHAALQTALAALDEALRRQG